MKNRIYGLDLLRSLAILLVLFLHLGESVHGFPPLLKTLGSIGWAGVDIFFVLSGFLIGGLLFNGNHNLAVKEKLYNFWVKRWFRTLPLYLLVLFVYGFIKPLAGWEFTGDLWSYFFFLQNFLTPRDFVQSWSLCIEEQFYLVFPLIAYLIPLTLKKRWLWFLPIVLSIVIRWQIMASQGVNSETDLSYLIRFPSYTHIDGILMGVLLAFYEKSWSHFVQKYHQYIFYLSTLGFFISLSYYGKTPLGAKAISCFFVLALFSAGMVSSAKFLAIPKFIQPIVYWIATLSYGIYLWNNLLMRVVDKFFIEIHWSLATLFFLITTGFISFITYRLVELPFMKLRVKFLRK